MFFEQKGTSNFLAQFAACPCHLKEITQLIVFAMDRRVFLGKNQLFMRLILHWPWWELNLGPLDLEDSVLTTIPLRLYLNLSVTMLYMNMGYFYI